MEDYRGEGLLRALAYHLSEEDKRLHSSKEGCELMDTVSSQVGHVTLGYWTSGGRRFSVLEMTSRRKRGRELILYHEPVFTKSPQLALGLLSLTTSTSLLLSQEVLDGLRAQVVALREGRGFIDDLTPFDPSSATLTAAAPPSSCPHLLWVDEYQPRCD